MGQMLGRAEGRYRGWPTRWPVSSLGALFLAVVAGIGIFSIQSGVIWTPLQRWYWNEYLGTEVFSTQPSRPHGYYRLLATVDRRGHHRVATDADVTPARLSQIGRQLFPFLLSPQARQSGSVELVLDTVDYNSPQMQALLAQWIYDRQSPNDLLRPAWIGGLGIFLLGLILAIPRDRARVHMLEHGRRLKGPQMVSLKEFNRWSGADGIGFVTTERKQVLATPRSFESSHFMVIGDSGTGKSALLRQMLIQIAKRGETAIVYDPALEYTPQFYQPSRGDLILNPLDARCPYWSPSDEVVHEAEALTLAASLFPDKPRENTFFVEGPRKIFAYLLTLKPSPEELVWWMSHEEELDRRLKGTELEMFIYRGAGPQRGGVLGALNMVADSLKLLPTQDEPKQRWTTGEWSKEPSGWLFLTSIPRFRERLLPLTSLWLDTLVLRLMNQGGAAASRAWFVLDELASLQRLPQLHTALTENRKSNNPVVIGFQGRSQMEVRYGHEAEAMLSQPATKIFLHTSEPRAARWISDTIGEVEMERFKETLNTGPFPHGGRSRSQHTETRLEPLVLPSEIQGLPRLHALMKVDNLVVPFNFPYIELSKVQPAFVEREARPEEAKGKKDAETVAPPIGAPRYQQRPCEGEPKAEPTKSVAANEQQPFFE